MKSLYKQIWESVKRIIKRFMWRDHFPTPSEDGKLFKFAFVEFRGLLFYLSVLHNSFSNFTLHGISKFGITLLFLAFFVIVILQPLDKTTIVLIMKLDVVKEKKQMKNDSTQFTGTESSTMRFVPVLLASFFMILMQPGTGKLGQYCIGDRQCGQGERCAPDVSGFLICQQQTFNKPVLFPQITLDDCFIIKQTELEKRKLYLSNFTC